MKGLLKGLRYISQIFDSEDDEKEEPEMKIGYPTDVKHVSHIGWDGPSVKNSPSWMNDFKPSSPRQSSPAPSAADDDKKNASSFDGVHEEWCGGIAGTHSHKSSPAPESSKIPKSSRRHYHSSSSGDAESLTEAKSEKRHQPPRRSSKGSHQEREASDASKPPQQQSMDSAAADTILSQLPDLPKKSRRKKPKDSGASTRLPMRPSKPQGKESCSSSAHENESPSARRNVRDGSQGSDAVVEPMGLDMF
ncbi:hypothetical protein BT93_B0974 [Corymbia citriodora subsp. variegata]|nr:hypothetical protein BT93_B0974 [Corymbia citriodora subsp. variegata]